MNDNLSKIINSDSLSVRASMWWLGQMGLMVKINDTLICIDYFASMDEERQTKPPIPAEEVKGVSVFIGTHDHLDHIDHEAWKIWCRNNPDAKFVFPRMHMDKVLLDGIQKENAVGLNDGETITIKDVTITAIASSHEFLDKDPETGLYPHLQYLIEGNGIRIHHAGDTVRYEGMLGKVTSRGKIDAQLLPINGRDAVRYRRNCIGNMTYQEAADFAWESGSRLVIPGHFDMFLSNSADPFEFKDYIEAKYNDKLNCKIPEVMEEIKLY